MKRFATATVLSVLIVAVPATSASAATYSGSFGGGGELAFTVKNNKVRNFQFAQVPVTCKNTPPPTTTSGGLDFNVKVKKGKFKASAFAGNNPNKPKAILEVTGKIKQGEATGTFNVKGKKLGLVQGGRDDCRSGDVDWVAAKSQPMNRASGAGSTGFQRR